MTCRRMPLTHPGGSIRDSMEAMGWTVTECARHLGIPREHLSRLLNGHIRHITRDGAIVGAHRLEQRQVLAAPASLLRSRPGAPPTDGCITARRSVPRSARAPALGALDLLAAVLFLALFRHASKTRSAASRPASASSSRFTGPACAASPRHPNYFAEIAMWWRTGPPSAASASPCRLQVPGLPGPTRRQRRR